ncbi:RNA methyltransferase [Prolixibacter denitrificans]|jgi:tRNA G18 (ribose-2'-O)-methylase SpoU|uniref:SpoU rRNA methylase family protein n=1 Tax=Prolixibacter denitrificans TaxID=1541063 RepID=A0A2P8CKF1_9BACT|nr:RNA methyltransferase [Prolixibacter denitrificans]PSK85454.1 SpoU rRNA methylase family protein [Prolixibacter denitrificans]GET20074.1 tRNA/rRNA methyltransferase [Prolixibacter denitrificans]
MTRKLKTNELGRLSVDEFKEADKLPVTVVLDNIRSGNNVGSVFRTSDALRVERIILCGITATPPNKEIHKTAIGAEKSIDWEYFKHTEEAVQKLKDEGYRIAGVEQVENSTLLPDFKANADTPLALVFGNEVKGVQQQIIDMCDENIEIPQYGTKHSFNISVSAGIVLWDICNKMRR